MKIRLPDRLPANANALLIGAWAPSFYLPCPFKAITGIDCPGCGFQRSVVALWEGDWTASLQLYPPAIPLLALFAFLGLKWLFKWDRKDWLARRAGIVVVGIVLVSYALKLLRIAPLAPVVG